MPKEIMNVTIERKNGNEAWGFIIIGGKDQSLTVKIGKVKPYSPAEKAGLRPFDYIWTINGKEVFEMSHNECVNAIKNSGNTLNLSTERGDHIVPNFEEIWPSKKGPKSQRPKTGLEYYYDAMLNGPSLSGFLPLPPNFTTVGRPNIVVNQYDSPIDCYSDDTLEEMKEERLVLQNPEATERLVQKAAPVNPLAAMQARKFDPTKSNVIGCL